MDASAAAVYDRFFVPALFAEWPPRVADAAGIGPGQGVLDVACGTGALTREALARVGPGGSVTGLDRSPGMLSVARGATPGASFVEGRAEALPFGDGAFDAVVSQFGLMFFEDRIAALREMARVLKPGGGMAVAVWAALGEVPGYTAMVELLTRLFGRAVGDELRWPYCLGDAGEVRTLFAEAGLDASVERHPGTARFPSIADWVHTDVYGWTLAGMLDDGQYATLKTEAETALARFADADGSVRFAHPALIVTVR